MPNVDEELQQRDTFGHATGWSANQGIVPDGQPLTAVVKPKEELPAPDAAAASSADEAPPQEPVSESAPPPSSQPEPERTFNMPPPQRWEELRRQREEAERRAQQAEQLAQLALQKLQAPQAPPVPQKDSWEGFVNHPDPATAQFYQQQRVLIQAEAERLADAKLQGVLQVVDAGRRELAAIKIDQFRKENPEIQQGSPEEAAIAGLVQQGFDLQAAKKLALYDRLEAENRALKAKQSSAVSKRQAANVESSAGIPQTAGLPRQSRSALDRASETLDKGGSMLEVAKSFFGG